MAELDLTLYGDEKVLLRTSFFGGFEKKEVLTYIDKLRKQNRTMAQELAEHINEVSTARNQLSEQVSSFEVKITEMERQLEERGGKIRELTGTVESLRNEVSQQKLRQIEREKELQQQRDQNRQLVVQLQNYEYKAKRYEDVSAQIGDIILDTNQRAADTVAQAQAQGMDATEAAARFHLSLARALAGMAGRAARKLGLNCVGLTGGVLQNATLARLLPLALAEQGLTALTHHELPPGDGGLSLGQAVWGRRMLARAKL